MTVPQVEAQQVRVADYDINHTVSCHSDNVSICGVDITDDPWVMDSPNRCVVCDELEAAEDALPATETCTCPCCVEVSAEVSA